MTKKTFFFAKSFVKSIFFCNFTPDFGFVPSEGPKTGTKTDQRRDARVVEEARLESV